MASVKTWTTANGRVLKVRTMTDEHLVNTLKYFRRRVSRLRAQELMAGQKALCFLQGEMAIEAVESDLRILESMSDDEFLCHTVPNWRNILNEAIKRKLDKSNMTG